MITLDARDAQALRDAQKAYDKLQRDNRIIMLRLEAAELEAQRQHADTLEALAEHYKFDASKKWVLGDDNTLRPWQPPAASVPAPIQH